MVDVSGSHVKIVILGEGKHCSLNYAKPFQILARVGKTSLLLRYVQNKFSDSQQSTMDATFLEK